MGRKQNIVMIDTDPSLVPDLDAGVKPLGFTLCRSTETDGSIQRLSELRPQLVILGPSLDVESCFKSIHKIKIIDPHTPVLTCAEDICPAKGSVNATSFEGIHHFNPSSPLNGVLETMKKALEQKAKRESRPVCPIIIGHSPPLNSIREKIRKLADKDVAVLITGESGTGKELIARSIHHYSRRSSGPLVKINCTTLPDELIESEIFGFQKGAFTGAHRDKPGRLELAHNGTLFIDEVGDLSPSLQAKFLQVLEDKEFSRLGGTSDKVIDARIIAATNRDLWGMLQEGSFRKDIFYRLDILNIEAPTLRERKADIPLLVDYFLTKYCYELKKECLVLPDRVLRHFERYHWPGNVREMENIIRRIIALGDPDIIFDELHLEGRNTKKDAKNPFHEHMSQSLWGDEKINKVFRKNNFSMKKTTKTFLAEVERKEILKALYLTEWNRRKAAELLQVSYKTLINRIIEFNLNP